MPSDEPTVGPQASPSPGVGSNATSTISGFVYLDLNQNGIFDDGEPGIGGVTITLTGSTLAHAEGAALVAAAVSQTTVTGGNGGYSFSGLADGTYSLSARQPNCQDGAETVGSAGGSVGNDEITTIELAGVSNGAGYNFGEQLPCGGGGINSFANTAGQSWQLLVLLGVLLLLVGSLLTARARS